MFLGETPPVVLTPAKRSVNAYVVNLVAGNGSEPILADTVELVKKGPPGFLKNKGAVPPVKPEPAYALKVARQMLHANAGDISTPLDNALAVSSTGYVISLTNGVYNIFNQDGDSVYACSLFEFFGRKLKMLTDPRVVFDYDAGRFVVFVIGAAGSSDKPVLGIAFSKSENPADGWYQYQLSGNLRPGKRALGQSFDFPKLCVTSDGIFVTGDMVRDRSSFQGSVLLQVEKGAGFSGARLHYCVWDSLDRNPRELLPVRYGFEGTYGPGLFLLSTKFIRLKYRDPNRESSDSLYLYEVEGNVFNGGATIRGYYVKTTPFYPFWKAKQKDTTREGADLENMDVRIDDGFFARDKLFFVFESGKDGYSKINYNILDLKTLTNRSKLVGDCRNCFYSYPSVAPLSDTSSPDVKSLVLFNTCSPTSYVSIGSKLIDEAMVESPEKLLVRGLATVKPQLDDAGNTDKYRLGDYTCVGRNPGKRENWVAASYPGEDGILETFLGTIVLENQAKPAMLVQMATPRPTKIYFHVQKEDQEITVLLKKAGGGGKWRQLYSGAVERGLNCFNYNSFLTRAGDYALRIIGKDDQKIRSVLLHNNQVVKQQ